MKAKEASDILFHEVGKYIGKELTPEEKDLRTALIMGIDALSDLIKSENVIFQLRWECDVALKQLKELGIGLGERIDGIYLSKEECDKLMEYKYMYEDLCK